MICLKHLGLCVWLRMLGPSVVCTDHPTHHCGRSPTLKPLQTVGYDVCTGETWARKTSVFERPPFLPAVPVLREVLIRGASPN